MGKFCQIIGDNRLKRCQAEKKGAFTALADAIDHNGKLEKALSVANTRIDDLTYQLQPDFEVSPAPVFGSAWVNVVLATNLPNYPGGVAWWPMDVEYRAATEEEIIKFILWDDTNFWQYHPELKDCDDFGFYFAARFRWFLERNNCFFTVDWSGRHAYAVFLLRSDRMWIYEPQNDRWWVAGEHGFQMPYPLEHVGLVG